METEALRATVWICLLIVRPSLSALLPAALSCQLRVPFPHVALPARALWHVLSALGSYQCPLVSKWRFATEHKPVSTMPFPRWMLSYLLLLPKWHSAET